PEALRAFQDLSIYTTAEACPMVSEVSPGFMIFLKQPTDVEDHGGRYYPQFLSSCDANHIPISMELVCHGHSLGRVQGLHLRHIGQYFEKFGVASIDTFLIRALRP